MIIDESVHLLRPNFTKSKKKSLRSFILAALFTGLVINTIFHSSFSQWPVSLSRPNDSKKNVIFFVTDGMGPASLSMTRSFRQYVEHLGINDTLTLDKYLIGNSRTMSSSSLITDSAAGATAFSCALKSYNGAIGVDPSQTPCGTILEAAKLKGLLTGLVVTTRLTDATPASFSSHVDYRFQEDLIAQHQMGEYPLGRMVDLMIGGGRTHFYSPSDISIGLNGSRLDNRNLIEDAQKRGWKYVNDRYSFDLLDEGKNVTLPLLALLADYDIPFDLDRKDSEYPSLEEQAITALTALTEATKKSDKGFFLMIEGSRIDHAGHLNDAAAQVREVLAFDKAFKAVLDYVSKMDTETILISTSDHETGGLVTARQLTKEYPEYIWYPNVLNNTKHSGEYLCKKIIQHFSQNNLEPEDKYSFIEKIFEEDLGIFDYIGDDITEILESTTSNDITYKLNSMVSTRAQIGWTTHGHSAVDVNIYGYSNKPSGMSILLKKLSGNHENTEIGKFIADYLKLDLEVVTELIKDTKHSSDNDLFGMKQEGDTYHSGNRY